MKLRIKLASLFAAFALVIPLVAIALETAPAKLSATESATEANITLLTARVLASSQFSHHPLDNELASRFLDRYLDALDGGHFLFLQSDIQEFAPYRTTLARITRRTGNSSAAQIIFDRYLERLEQRTAFITNALQTRKFTFTGHDTYSLDREKAPWPADLADAKKLWWEQLRFEYLQEKLADKKPAEVAMHGIKGPTGVERAEKRSEKLTDKNPAEIVKTLEHRYGQLQRTMKEMSRDEVLDVYLDVLAHVYDPHSDYFGHEEMADFGISMNLSLFGIGATLESDDGYCKIHELVPGGPAAKSGQLKPGDRIVAVAQAHKEPVDIVNMPLTHAVELIRGPKGTVVKLTIIPANAGDSTRKTITLVRDEIKLEDEQAKAAIVDLPVADGKTFRVGVIDLPSFYANLQGKHGEDDRSATVDVAELLRKLEAEHVQGVILDIRRNGGGSLEEAINLTGLFIPAGPVVQTRGPSGDIDVGASTNATPLYNGPLIVLVSRFSASASEILAGALQDYGRAVIVGDSSTFGKGTVQSILSLAPVMNDEGLSYAYDPGALKITIRKFYRPSGASTQLKGVASNIVLPSSSDTPEVSESALKDPLPWDVIASSDFTPLNRVKPYLAELKDESAKRVASEKAFIFLRDDIARLRKEEAEKSVSMNEAVRRKEMAEARTRQKEQNKELDALHEKIPTAYDITLKNALLPGLPPAVAVTNKLAMAATNTPSADDEDLDVPDDEAPSPGKDIILTEAERILTSYAEMLKNKGTVPAGPKLGSITTTY
jgi:carboxyl-terminal processing protease